MRFLLAVCLPPVAVLFCGKPFQAFLNLILTCFFWVPGAVHAVFVVHHHLEDQRLRRLLTQAPGHAAREAEWHLAR